MKFFGARGGSPKGQTDILFSVTTDLYINGVFVPKLPFSREFIPFVIINQGGIRMQINRFDLNLINEKHHQLTDVIADSFMINPGFTN